MTVLSTDPPYEQYTGTGARVFFEYGFQMLEDSDVFVLVDGVPVPFTQQDTGVVLDPAPALNAVILIFRITDITQLSDWVYAEAFFAEKTEDALDKLILLKQEAAAFRAAMNLYALPTVSQVEIVNDKGSNATIFIWTTDKAGVFSGEVTQNMPAAGAFVEKPLDFAYFQYGAEVILTQELTTTLYPLEAEEAIYFSIALTAGAMYSIPNESQDLSWIFSGGTMAPLLFDLGPYNESQDLSWEFIGGTMAQSLIAIGPYFEEQDLSWSFLGGTLIPQLVAINSPPEGMTISITLASGSMTPV
jgi:hypothetical protein